jgi:hypothetical protein
MDGERCAAWKPRKPWKASSTAVGLSQTAMAKPDSSPVALAKGACVVAGLVSALYAYAPVEGDDFLRAISLLSIHQY